MCRHGLTAFRMNPHFPVNTLKVMRGGADRGLQLPDVKERLLHNTQAAHERGAFGSPTFFVDGRIWFGKDRLCDVEEEIQRLNAAG